MKKRINGKYLLNEQYTKVLLKSTAVVFLSIVVFEILIHGLFPGLRMIVSHSLTLVFAAIATACTGYMILRNISVLHHRIEKKYEDAKKLEKALHLSEERYRMIFENAIDCLMLFELESGKLVDFNKNACKSLGYSPDEYAEITLDKLKVAAENVKLDDIISKLKPHSPPLSTEVRFRNRDGSIHDVITNTSIIEFKNYRYLLAVWKEVTQERKTEKELVETNKITSSLLETVPLPVFYKNKEGKYIGCNRAFEEFLGIDRNKILGRTVFDMGMPKDLAEKYHEKDRELIERPTLQVYQWKVTTKNKGTRDVVFHKTTFNDFEGKTAGIIGVIVDITDQKRMNERSESMRESLSMQNKILVGWTDPAFLYADDISKVFMEIIQTMSKLLDVERVSIWFYNDDFSKLSCLHQYERSAGWGTTHEELDVGKYPVYFSHLKSERVIACDDVMTDYRTKEFIKSYLLPKGITSMMDIPVHVAGRNIGVICCEHTGKQRHWLPENQNFAISAAHLASMIMEVSKRKEAEKNLLAAQDDFSRITEECEFGIIVADAKGKVLYTNNRAEKMFKDRTIPLLGDKFDHPLLTCLKKEILLPAGRESSIAAKAAMTVKNIVWKGNTAFLVTLDIIRQHQSISD